MASPPRRGYNSLMSASLLESMLAPLADCLTRESAERIVALRLSDQEQERVDALADKANLGTLTNDEMREYDEFLAGYHVVTLLQARARSLLRD
jgi:hypothetical protein